MEERTIDFSIINNLLVTKFSSNSDQFTIRTDINDDSIIMAYIGTLTRNSTGVPVLRFTKPGMNTFSFVSDVTDTTYDINLQINEEYPVMYFNDNIVTVGPLNNDIKYIMKLGHYDDEPYVIVLDYTNYSGLIMFPTDENKLSVEFDFERYKLRVDNKEFDNYHFRRVELKNYGKSIRVWSISTDSKIPSPVMMSNQGLISLIDPNNVAKFLNHRSYTISQAESTTIYEVDD